MDIRLFESLPDDREEMLGIFNYYVENSFATYTEEPVGTERFAVLMSFASGWPGVTARRGDGAMAGFGLLRPYSTIPAFCGTAELTCFIGPEFTGLGIGSAILGSLVDSALGIGLRTIVSTVSSLNEGSIRFHVAQGFAETGRLLQVGMKRGIPFDLVFLQKTLQPI
jgi:phosphinothricin acetyltransferase